MDLFTRQLLIGGPSLADQLLEERKPIDLDEIRKTVEFAWHALEPDVERFLEVVAKKFRVSFPPDIAQTLMDNPDLDLVSGEIFKQYHGKAPAMFAKPPKSIGGGWKALFGLAHPRAAPGAHGDWIVKRVRMALAAELTGPARQKHIADYLNGYFGIDLKPEDIIIDTLELVDAVQEELDRIEKEEG